MNEPPISTNPILTGLNEKQLEAVTTTDGPVLVIAGAGSGKTRALTHRIAYLIKERNIRPFQILAVTFTNKAAGEMKNRVLKLLGKQHGDYDLPTMGTFHSVCAKILRKHIHLLNFENQFGIYDTSDQLILMKHIFKELEIDPKELNPRSVLSHISNAKNKLIDPDQFDTMIDGWFAEKVARFYHLYQDRLKKNNALDFDDLLMKTVELFRAHPSILDKYQEQFRYIHVDEYQDTNHTQYALTNMLAAKYRNLCVIGDHDQSIYSWRGADITNILQFEKDYKEAKVIKMEQNYRSSKPILEAAQAVIVKNKKRKDKTLWTEREGGEKLRVWVAQNERNEGEMIAQEIKKIMKSHEFPDYRDFVLLYRTNAQSRVLEEVFMRFGMPYKIIGGIRFYERKEIKDLIAYLRVISNPHDTVSLMRIINVPQRQIGPKTLEKIQTLASIRDCTFFEAMVLCDEIGDLPEMKREKIKKFTSLIRRLQKENHGTSASGIIKYVLSESGYKKFLDDGTIEGESRMENVAELVSVATKYDKLEPGISLNIFLEEVALISDLDSMDEKDNAVTFMTLHSAKGLEFPNVFICGLEEGLLPHSQSMLAPEQLEEERRLFYVGCTRAMDNLYLLYTKNRMLYGESQNTIPSQFLTDIPKELIETNIEEKSSLLGDIFGFRQNRRSHGSASMGPIGKRPIPQEKIATEKTKPVSSASRQFSDGDRVMHKIYGEGIVINVLGGIVTVAFKDPIYGIKRLAVEIAPMEKI